MTSLPGEADPKSLATTSCLRQVCSSADSVLAAILRRQSRRTGRSSLGPRRDHDGSVSATDDGICRLQWGPSRRISAPRSLPPISRLRAPEIHGRRATPYWRSACCQAEIAPDLEHLLATAEQIETVMASMRDTSKPEGPHRATLRRTDAQRSGRASGDTMAMHGRCQGDGQAASSSYVAEARLGLALRLSV